MVVCRLYRFAFEKGRNEARSLLSDTGNAIEEKARPRLRN